MFRWCCCCRKKSKHVVDSVAGERKQTSSSQRSVSVPDTPAATSNKHEETPWCPLFGCLMPKKEKQSVATSQDEKSTYAEKAKKPWWSLCRNRCRVTPVSEKQNPKEQTHPTPHKDEDVKFKGLTEKEKILLGIHETVFQSQRKNNSKTLRQQKIKCLGFPNPSHICYINACLQSLLTLGDFVRAISRQEHLWNLIPEAALIRSFMDIKRSHLSGNAHHKISLLGAFKRTIWSPEFQDFHQKDAHEFLASVLEQMRCLSPQLQIMAASMGRSYSCPVEDHMVFKMVNTRTCKGCGVGSTREEQFTNLSLDVVPGGGSVEQMLQDYLMEKELEYNCECGATSSSQCSSFLTLPRVLVLHLKRFRFTPSSQFCKVHDPVVILRELVVSSNQDDGCYSLVSTISHIGLTARSGHYICDGVDQDVGEEDPTDRWFTYNDAEVTETSGESVCDQRKYTSYILSYRRHTVGRHVFGNTYVGE